MTIYELGCSQALQKLGMMLPTQLLGSSTKRGIKAQAKRKLGKTRRMIQRNPIKATAAAGAAGVGTSMALTGSS